MIIYSKSSKLGFVNHNNHTYVYGKYLKESAFIMRKNTKIVAVLSAAALLAIGASLTSFAAKGWTPEGDQWYYYDNSGDYVTDSWKKSGNNYFYLGDEGYMLTDALIQDGDNYYYVDQNGAMVKSQWRQIAADDSETEDVEYRWYYFGSTGRAYRATSGMTKKTINGKKYAFDTEGKMLFGFVTEAGDMTNTNTDPVLEADYYFGTNEDGAMYTGWLHYTEGVDDGDYDGKDSLWFYYSPSAGKKTVNADSKKIGKGTYRFDLKGVMETGWQGTTSNSNTTDSKYFSGDDEGWLKKNTWVYAVPSENIDAEDNADDTQRWFYVGSNGETVKNAAKRVNSKWYVFNENGIMQTGLVVLDVPSIKADAKILDSIDEDDVTGDDLAKATLTGTLYYFSGDEEKDGSMKTGSNVRIELADDVYTFGFNKNGSAYQGEKNNKLYKNGVLQTAGDMRYDVKEFGGKNYVVGSTGTIVKVKNVAKDADDNYYAVQADGTVVFFPAADEASAAARACAKGETTFKYDGETKNVYDFDGTLVVD